MLKRAIAMSLEQEEEEEELSSIKGEQKNPEKMDSDKCTKAFNFSGDSDEEMPSTGDEEGDIPVTRRVSGWSARGFIWGYPDEEGDGDAKAERKSSAPSDQVSLKTGKQ